MFVHVQVSYVKCPECNVAVDMHLLHISTLLGPPEVECHWCRAGVRTDRAEWWEMNWRVKCWFFAISSLYMVLIYFAGGLSTSEAIHFAQEGEWRQGWGIQEPAFWISGTVWSTLVALVQLYRIHRSLARKMSDEKKPLAGSWWSFQTGGQLKTLLLLLAIPGMSWIGVSAVKLLTR
jgi:hypothetical protein